MEKISPMMAQYLKTKEEYSDCILFYRLGDFYEMFFDDALYVSKALELTLTGKDCGMSERAPMCGIPYHAAEVYIQKLVDLGKKVAIAEQLEDPKTAKGLVKRDVIRVVTPGTVISSTGLDETKNNYIMCLFYSGSEYGLAVSDITTGEFLFTVLHTAGELKDELSRFLPTEIIANDFFFMSGVDIKQLAPNSAYSTLPGKMFSDEKCFELLKKHFGVASTSALGGDGMENGLIAAGALLGYLYETQKNEQPQITSIKPYTTGRYMIIDTATRRNLELTQTMREKSKRGTLLWVLDKTCTSMGARLLRKMIEQPLIKTDEIIMRQDAIEELSENFADRDELREYLNPVYDLERLISRICYRAAGPRDIIAFKNSLSMLPAVKGVLSLLHSEELTSCNAQLDDLSDLFDLIDAAINDDPPLLVHDGGIIKDGYSEEVDLLRRSKTEGSSWLSELEEKEREASGIKTLRVRFNKVFGYYFEVTNSFKDMVPDYFERKQTLVGAERYTTPRLKELESTILGADEKLKALEYDLFCGVRQKIAENIIRVQKSAAAVSRIDVYCSLSLVAQRNGYVRPSINDKGVIKIKNGRHPVVEQMLGDGQFIANDVLLDNKNNRINIITGPNMAGKSTFMRQVALITLMAQTGSFVPAQSADICVCDRIFTRVGASDDLSSGQSTFMVEMSEVSNILKNATKNSLIVLDEIGRGTSTYDGMSIAWAVVEYISDPKQIGAKTLFATHYHELTELEGAIPGVVNYCIAVREQGEDIIFLRKIIRGGADKSYGIQAARLAGVPAKVLQRAKELTEQLSDADIAVKTRETESAGSRKKNRFLQDDVEANQLVFSAAVREEDILAELKDLNVSNMTPIDALSTLYKWQNRLKNRV